MKWLKYRERVATVNIGSKEKPKMKDILQDMGLQYSETNEEFVKKKAYKGEYTIEDDGQPEPEVAPTQLDRVEAQVTYTAMMTDTLWEV
jgi:hypothetical protein